ncbi:hypothetical protein EYZ11_003495 [Aspergillus tanneri]|uniref:Transcription factor domain-containing protein n=1 Tax=Aspergillus tanneri TaxID=1220188 RepID=A0A4S3JN92_9EURO|nr:hypothetical protein EYZ11_003495 [Aspergillus tanneri]
MIHDISSFFHIDQYEGYPDSTSSGIFIHAYLLNSVLHTQRCKLHLRCLTSGPNNNPTYAFSREKCLTSARQVIHRGTARALPASLCVHTTALISDAVRVFLASIVLLMDAYINEAGSMQDEIRRGDVAEGLRIIEGARSHSWAAANLHESLSQALAKYRAQLPQHQQQQYIQEAPMPLPMSDVSSAPSAPVINTTTTQMAHRSDQPAVMSTLRGMDSGGTLGPMPDQMPVAVSQPLQYNQLAQSPEELAYTYKLQWDDLFSGIDWLHFSDYVVADHSINRPMLATLKIHWPG